jgi:conjugative transfer pilus assembly protein TraH
MIKRFLFLFFVLLPLSARADLSSEMNKFWNNLGGSSNSNSAYAGQSTGYYTGGSIHVRAPVIQQKPFNMQPPKIKAGCGGIDMFTGSFSHINMDQFVAQLKAIGANSVGYAFQLALQTISPSINSVTNKIQEVADTINGFNINSCESAKILVPNPLEQNLTLQESACAMMSLISGSSSDADAAKSYCKSNSNKSKENQKFDAAKKPTDINFVWQAMKNAGYVDALGVDTAEAFMTMFGTIILRQEEAPLPISPMALDADYVKALAEGGKIKIKECVDKNECLELRDKEITFSSTDTYKPKIKKLLEDMQDKIKKGEGSLTAGELALIGQTSLPILKIMINNSTGKSPVTDDVISEIVARDTLNRFLQDISRAIRMKLAELELVNGNQEMIETIKSNVKMVDDYLVKEEKEIKNKMDQTLAIIKFSEDFDRQLASSFSGRIKSVLDFSNSLNTGTK